MAIEVSPEQRREMEAHAEEAYPHECCGILIGSETGGIKKVSAVLRSGNLRDDSPQNRYLIDPREFMKADRQARDAGQDIVGIYHSHPDHPSKPSEFDREHAWPYYSYIIFSVRAGKVADARCWLLEEDRSAFTEEAAAGLESRA